MVPPTFATQIVLPPSSNSLASPSAGSSDSMVSLRKGIWFRAVRDCQVCARGCQIARDYEKSAEGIQKFVYSHLGWRLLALSAQLMRSYFVVATGKRSCPLGAAS